jgi:quinol monooxygenase YgiN
METKIAEGQGLVTLINVFTVEPAKQARLVDALTDATEHVMSRMPGFVSANIHRSLDGTRVTNYAQWRSIEDFEAMRQDPAARDHMTLCAELATFDGHLYDVAFVESRADEDDEAMPASLAPMYSPPSRL